MHLSVVLLGLLACIVSIIAAPQLDEGQVYDILSCLERPHDLTQSNCAEDKFLDIATRPSLAQVRTLPFLSGSQVGDRDMRFVSHSQLYAGRSLS